MSTNYKFKAPDKLHFISVALVDCVNPFIATLMDSIKIREINKTEISQLDSFLYQAIFIPHGQKKPDQDIISSPLLQRYIEDFGKNTDLCFVAVLQGNLIGAIWTRIFVESEPGFGYVDSETPELSMSVDSNYRNKGIGTGLLTFMLDKLTTLEYEQVSLSVDKLNYAFELYKKMGFEIITSDAKSATMIKRLQNTKAIT